MLYTIDHNYNFIIIISPITHTIQILKSVGRTIVLIHTLYFAFPQSSYLVMYYYLYSIEENELIQGVMSVVRTVSAVALLYTIYSLDYTEEDTQMFDPVPTPLNILVAMYLAHMAISICFPGNLRNIYFGCILSFGWSLTVPYFMCLLVLCCNIVSLRTYPQDIILDV